MDLVTVTGFRTVAELMHPEIGMDNYEYECWLQYWKENLFGPFANNYQAAQIAGSAAHAFGGGSWSPIKYMVRMLDKEQEPAQITEAEEQSAAFEIMSIFGGIDKAKEWRGNNANN